MELPQYPSILGGLVSATVCAYWLSIAISQKDGPFGVLAYFRSLIPFLGNSNQIGAVLSILVYSIITWVPYGWLYCYPFTIAGGIVILLGVTGTQDYEID